MSVSVLDGLLAERNAVESQLQSVVDRVSRRRFSHDVMRPREYRRFGRGLRRIRQINQILNGALR